MSQGPKFSWSEVDKLDVVFCQKPCMIHEEQAVEILKKWLDLFSDSLQNPQFFKFLLCQLLVSFISHVHFLSILLKIIQNVDHLPAKFEVFITKIFIQILLIESFPKDFLIFRIVSLDKYPFQARFDPCSYKFYSQTVHKLIQLHLNVD